MAEWFVLTKDMMEKATDYIPCVLKEVIATNYARECVKPTYMVHPDREKAPFEDGYGLEPVWCENTLNKSRLMMGCLMTFYLNARDTEKPLMPDIEEYDALGKAHVLNQIERYKSGEHREKAFDLLADYRELEKYLNSAIYAVLRELNDPIRRFMHAMGEIGSSEGIQNALESIRQSQEGIVEERERQGQIIHGEGEEIAE